MKHFGWKHIIIDQHDCENYSKNIKKHRNGFRTSIPLHFKYRRNKYILKVFDFQVVENKN